MIGAQIKTSPFCGITGLQPPRTCRASLRTTRARACVPASAPPAFRRGVLLMLVASPVILFGQSSQAQNIEEAKRVPGNVYLDDADYEPAVCCRSCRRKEERKHALDKAAEDARSTGKSLVTDMQSDRTVPLGQVKTVRS